MVRENSHREEFNRTTLSESHQFAIFVIKSTFGDKNNSSLRKLFKIFKQLEERYEREKLRESTKLNRTRCVILWMYPGVSSTFSECFQPKSGYM